MKQTPKEKAKQLVELYDETLTYLESKSKAKQCALIAVDEILNELSIWGAPYLFETSCENDWAEKRILYLIEVKEEIINL